MREKSQIFSPCRTERIASFFLFHAIKQSLPQAGPADFPTKSHPLAHNNALSLEVDEAAEPLSDDLVCLQLIYKCLKVTVVMVY